MAELAFAMRYRRDIVAGLRRPTPRVVAVVPAHNEEAAIGAAVASLRRQDVHRIVVVADNCTDDTVALAQAAGAEVVTTRENTAKKAGALNQALAWLMPKLAATDYLLVMDADSELDDGFATAARGYLDADRQLAGVSGTFRGGTGGGFVGMCQRNEYARYARDVRRLKGRALVLTGTAAVFRVSSLRQVQLARHDGRLPEGGGDGRVYDEKVLTEDNELTLALLHLGYRILAPSECTLTTEVMPTWGQLAKQRLRWKRGALENIRDYGLTRVTAAYWGRQALSAVSVIATLIYMATLLWALGSGAFHVQPLWMALTGVFVMERTVTVRDRGPVQQAIGASLVPEMVYDVFLQAVQAWAFFQSAIGAERRW